ncbi:hypothetical protein [Halegenticoccus tardaugens]|uniref:hypothetical protein n=1 Tax=Halegenticoccus tardaugens TaxID=2071624 RepID=UPI001E45D414|nr:hypothetical protein [Halegenticoccus tardaugens]
MWSAGAASFALVFVDPAADAVRTGREAARELCDRAGMPVLVGDVVGDNYESPADAVRTATGVDRNPDPYHGVHSLTPDAREPADRLLEKATSWQRMT